MAYGLQNALSMVFNMQLNPSPIRRLFGHRRFASEAGLTLIEVMIAAAIFVVGIMGILFLQGNIILGHDFSGSNTVARSLLSDRMNTLLFRGYTAATLTPCGGTPFCHRDIANGVNNPPIPGGNTTPWALMDEQGLTQSQPIGRFARDWDVQAAPAPFAATAKLIRVRVAWNDKQVEGKAGGAPNRNLVYSAIYAQP